MLGTARYAARCSALFHISVPTRSSPVTPRSSRSAWARRAAIAPTSPYEVRRGPSAVQVTTSAELCTVRPCSSSRDTCSGVSIIVLRMAKTLRPSSVTATALAPILAKRVRQGAAGPAASGRGPARNGSLTAEDLAGLHAGLHGRRRVHAGVIHHLRDHSVPGVRAHRRPAARRP